MTNSKRVRFLTLFFCLVFAGVCREAGQTSWKQAVDNATELQNRGEFVATERVLLAILNQADPSDPDDARAATVLNNLGVLYQQLGRYGQAEKCLLRSIALWRKQFADDDVLPVHSLGSLAALYIETGSYTKVELLDLGRVVTRWESSHPEEPDLAQLLTCLGAVAVARGKYSEAERLQKQALTVTEKLGLNSFEAGRLLNNLGVFYLRSGRNAEALACLRRALEIAENIMGKEHSLNAQLLVNLADAERAVHGPRAAESFYKRALVLMESSMDPHHPLRADILSRYARALREMKRKGEAKECERHAKSIFEAAFRANRGQQTVDVSDLLPRNAKR